MTKNEARELVKRLGEALTELGLYVAPASDGSYGVTVRRVSDGEPVFTNTTVTPSLRYAESWTGCNINQRGLLKGGRI